ncbi:BA3454 family stress response protein [Bacillus sp. EB600]|nr:BA3454 family stress response protein [Bacillus sp. EB600]MCQ6281519.1 BA3454 family stress response protein [Bacillus sp. EB600]
MIEVTVTVKYKGKNYQTNILANKGMPCEKIMHLAKKQVVKQWSL